MSVGISDVLKNSYNLCFTPQYCTCSHTCYIYKVFSVNQTYQYEVKAQPFRGCACLHYKSDVMIGCYMLYMHMQTCIHCAGVSILITLHQPLMMETETFLGYQPCRVSVWNQCFENHLGHHHQGSGMSTEPLVSCIYTSLALG